MAHYYTDNTELSHAPRIVRFRYGGKEIAFHSDAGVFSRDNVDYGTRVLLETMHEITGVERLLDVGCGYGVIGISQKLMHPTWKVDMVDVNSRALDLAKQTIADYGLEDIDAFISDCYARVKGEYDLILSNPPIRAGKKVVHAILEGAFGHLAPHGRLRIVIQKKQGAPSAKAKMEAVFGNCTILKRDKGYYILESVKIADE